MALRPTVSHGLPSPCGFPRRQRRIGGGFFLRRIDPHNPHPLTGFESTHALSFFSTGSREGGRPRLPAIHISPYIYNVCPLSSGISKKRHWKPCLPSAGQVYDYLPLFDDTIRGFFLCRPAELCVSLIHRIHSLIAGASVRIGYPDRFQRILIPPFSELDNPQNLGYDSFSTCRCRIDGIADPMLIGAFQYEEV